MSLKKTDSHIKSCTCQNAYQDKKYGKGKRVMNATTKDTYRCTVCAREK